MQKFYGCVVWFIVTLFVVYQFCLNTAAAVFSHSIQAALHVSSVGVSIASGGFIVGFACMQIPAGFLLDRFNPRYVVSCGIFLLALGNWLISYADTLPVYTLCNAMQGMGASFSFIAAAVLTSQWFSAAKFPIVFGLTQTFASIFAGLAHYYYTLALTEFSWNTLYRSLAVFGFCLLAASVAFIRSPANYQREVSLSFKESLSIVLKNKQIILCSVTAAMSFGVLLAYASLWYAKIEAGNMHDPLYGVMISGLIFFGIGVGTPIMGWISNRCQSRTAVLHFSLCLGVMLLLVRIYLPQYDTDISFLVEILAFVIGFLLSGAMLLYTLVSELSSNATRGVAMSVLNTMVFLFNAAMLFIPHWFVTKASTHFYTYLWTVPFFIIFAILLTYFIREERAA